VEREKGADMDEMDEKDGVRLDVTSVEYGAQLTIRRIFDEIVPEYLRVRTPRGYFSCAAVGQQLKQLSTFVTFALVIGVISGMVIGEQRDYGVITVQILIVLATLIVVMALSMISQSLRSYQWANRLHGIAASYSHRLNAGGDAARPDAMDAEAEAIKAELETLATMEQRQPTILARQIVRVRSIVLRALLACILTAVIVNLLVYQVCTRASHLPPPAPLPPPPPSHASAACAITGSVCMLWVISCLSFSFWRSSAHARGLS
jgi:hypothetical protein